jgi:hypothetical protein
VENIIIIYLDGSEFSRQFSTVHFYRQNTDAKLLRPLNFHGSASVLYKPMYRPLFFSIVLDLILFGSNKGYCSCSPLLTFPHKLQRTAIQCINLTPWQDSNPRSAETITTPSRRICQIHLTPPERGINTPAGVM